MPKIGETLPAVKSLCCLLLAILLAVPPRAQAEDDNRYTVLGQAMAPFANLFAKNTKNPKRAMQLSGRLDILTGLPRELLGARVELALEYPDKLRLRAPVLGEELVICRRGQELWAYPGTRAKALLEAAGVDKNLPKPDPKVKLPPFALPIPETQLALLPALFQVKDVGAEPVDGDPCRVMDIFLMPELSKSLRHKEGAARVWIREDHTPARLSMARPGWQMSVRFDRVVFSKTLPPETWKPTAEQAGDILKLDPARYGKLLEVLFK